MLVRQRVTWDKDTEVNTTSGRGLFYFYFPIEEMGGVGQ